MQILLTIGYSALFIFLIGKLRFYRLPGISSLLLKSGFVIKLFAGISVGLIYTYYYTDRLTADTFKFFDDSEILFNALKTNPVDYFRMLTGIGSASPALQPYYDSMTNWYDTFSPFNDNRTIIRLNAFLRLFSMGYYYVHVSFVCFLSFTGIVAIVKVFIREFPELTKEIFLTFLLLPSVIFWGSGLLKDALVFFTFGMTLLVFDKMLHVQKTDIKLFLIFLVALFLLMITKFQVFIISLPLLLSWWVAKSFRWNPGYTFLAITTLFFCIIYFIPYLIPQWDVVQLLVSKQKAFFELTSTTDAGSAISIPPLENNLSNLLINAPIGFFTSLIRPFITDAGALLNTISAIENTGILILGVICLLNMKVQNLKGKILPYFCLYYTIFSFTLIGMITPVLGAIVRYKAQALPFMVVLFLIIAHPVIRNYFVKIIPKSTK